MNAKERAELKQIQDKLAEMRKPGYYGSWCSGYLRKALEGREKALLAKQSKDKLKDVQLIIKLDSCYKWLARQPFGAWTAFKRKPKVYSGDEMGAQVEHWALQKGEYEICETGERGGDWKNSLRRI